jgi:uncharacterized membrane protein HdeD (DUF308 family)
MPDPASIQNWIFNAVSIFLIVEGVLNAINVMSKKKDTVSTISQARIIIQSILMIVAAIVIFWLNHSTPVQVNIQRPRNNFNSNY